MNAFSIPQNREFTLRKFGDSKLLITVTRDEVSGLRHSLAKLVSKIMSIIAHGQVTIATVEDGAEGQIGAAAVYRGLALRTAASSLNKERGVKCRSHDGSY